LLILFCPDGNTEPEATINARAGDYGPNVGAPAALDALGYRLTRQHERTGADSLQTVYWVPLRLASSESVSARIVSKGDGLSKA
jgi:hypothetical protein